jgi:hypothetical protein
LVSSNARAPTIVVSIAATNTIEPIGLRKGMTAPIMIETRLNRD